MSLCVIPARGGSKRIPRKNVRDFCGRPMIGWSIAAAREAGLRVVVSTDDGGIAEVARSEGAEVPFLRPAELADDMTGTVPVIAHAVRELGAEGPVCCLYATAPFVRAEDLAAGRAALGGATYAFPVTTFPFPIQRALFLGEDGAVAMREPEHETTRSQDLREAWHDAGQFYWGRAEAWAAGLPLYSSGARGVPVPRARVQDIDTEEDWARAEWLFRAMRDGV